MKPSVWNVAKSRACFRAPLTVRTRIADHSSFTTRDPTEIFYVSDSFIRDKQKISVCSTLGWSMICVVRCWNAIHVAYRRNSRNTITQGMSGPATAGQILTAALPVRVFYQSARIVPCCFHLALSLTTINQTVNSVYHEVNYSNKPRVYIYEPTHLIVSYNKPRTILGSIHVLY